MLRFLVCVIFCSCPLVFSMELPYSQECSACHFSSRTHAEARFPTGFGRWENAQCFGCHNELTEVATMYTQGKMDDRFSSLPISDDRISRMKDYPLPYLNAAFDPIGEGENRRTTKENLTNFLRRPHGHCSNDGNCSAPAMMVYPRLKKTIVFNKNNRDDQKQSAIGKDIFEEKCSGCHTTSDISGYNATAMSLFSVDWLYRYANNLNIKKDNRQMPTMTLTKQDSNHLYAYFQSLREEKEAEVDALAKKYISNFQNKNKSLTVSNINYMWDKFWRDGDCVHCHSIGGRATEKFDTSTQGLVTWLKNNKPKILVDRLITRHAEQKVGIGAENPGMPMTGQPLSFTAITILATWIDMGCPDQNFKKFCAQDTLATVP